MLIAIYALLLIAGGLAGGGYIGSAYSDFGGREAMPQLLIAFILAIGFLGLIAR